MVLPDVLAILKKRSNNPTSFHLRKLRKSLEDKDGSSVDHSGFFDGVQRRCIKIPRRILDKELLELIDKGITNNLHFHFTIPACIHNRNDKKKYLREFAYKGSTI